MEFNGLKYLVIGSGFFGLTIAQKIADNLCEKVLLIDKKETIGGNSSAKIDDKTKIEYHLHGSHIFHTSNEKVWNYLNNFTEFNNYRHKVFSIYKDKTYPMPINLTTINSFYGINLKPFEVENFIKNKRKNITNPQNLEEKAISQIGEDLYTAFIKGYTQKQWGIEPKTLPKEIITRLPVRNNYNSDYFNNTYQGLPINGYQKLFEQMIRNKNITLKLKTDYYDIKDKIPKNCKIIFTGSIDKLFDYEYGKLEYRSLRFEFETLPFQDYQGTSVINYADANIPYTRIHEFKHYHTEKTEIFNSNKTIICKEFPKNYNEDNEPYYPINNDENNKKYALYQQKAAKINNLYLGGRLGLYQYLDIDKTIEKALDLFKKIKEQL